MKLASLLLFCLALALAACDRPRAATPPSLQSQSPVSSAPKPAQSDKLLLLDEETPTANPTGETADNSRCQVCHLNLVTEDLAAKHAKANIGCAKCHGESDDHIADESWASGGNGTAPTTMFPPDKINPSCYACHPKDKLDPDLHKAFLAGTSDKKLCTHCHGNHKMVNRKCKWK